MSEPTNLSGNPMEGLALVIYNIARDAARAEWDAEIAQLRDEVHEQGVRLSQFAESAAVSPFGLHSVKA